MERNEAISRLADYAVQSGLIEDCERVWAINTILDVLKLDSYTQPEKSWDRVELAPVLEALLDDAYARGVLTENSVVYRDLFDSELMGRLTPRPHEGRESFRALQEHEPRTAPDWYYTFPQNTN